MLIRVSMGIEVNTGRINAQYCHKYRKPQFLGANQRVRIDPPLSSANVVEVSKDYEGPGSLPCVRLLEREKDTGQDTYRQAQPSNEAMVAFKHIVVVAK